MQLGRTFNSSRVFRYLNGIAAEILFACHAELVEALCRYGSFEKLRMTGMKGSSFHKKIVAESPTGGSDEMQVQLFKKRPLNSFCLQKEEYEQVFTTLKHCNFWGLGGKVYICLTKILKRLCNTT